jgi:hypothetical protein
MRMFQLLARPLVAAIQPARRTTALFLSLALCFVPAGSTNLSAAEAIDPKHPDASAAVCEALQREIYGSDTSRRELLEAAVAMSPEFAPARWHLGYVKDARRGWLKHDEFLKTPKVAHALAKYERERAIAPDTVADNLKMAD